MSRIRPSAPGVGSAGATPDARTSEAVLARRAPRPGERAATPFPPACHRTGWSPERTRLTLEEHRAARRELPLVSRLRESRGQGGEFRRVGLIGSQHLYDSTATMLRELKLLGLSPDQAAILGKSYSGSPVVRADLALDGFEVDNLDFFEGLPGVDRSRWPERYRSVPNPVNKRHFALHEMRGRLARSEIDSLQLLDDGADLILALAEHYPELVGCTSAVEQTRFGARRLRKSPPPFPVVNVAESPVKLWLESVLIGWSIAEEMARTLDTLAEQGIPRGRDVVVYGYGAIGRTAALLLEEKGFTVRVVDPSKEARAQAKRDGLPAERQGDDWLGQADYVLGTTGETSLGAEQLRRLKDGAVLFSGSSSTVEFACAGEGIRTEERTGDTASFRGRPVQLYSEASPELPHEIVSCAGKQFLLAKGGTPINLTADPDPIPAPLIQLTRGLLFLGLLQAKRAPEGTSGLLELDPAGQLELARGFMSEVVRPQPALLSPRARALLEEGYARVVQELEPKLAAQPAGASNRRLPRRDAAIEPSGLDPSPALIDWKKKLGRMHEGLEPFDRDALLTELRLLPPLARQEALRVAHDIDPSLSLPVSAEDPLEELVGLAGETDRHRVLERPRARQLGNYVLQVGQLAMEVDCAGTPPQALENARQSIAYAERVFKDAVEVTGLDGVSTTRAVVRGKDEQAVRAVVRRLGDWVEAAGIPARAPLATADASSADREAPAGESGRGRLSGWKGVRFFNRANRQPTEEHDRLVRDAALATLVELKDRDAVGAAMRELGEALIAAGYELEFNPSAGGTPYLRFQERRPPRRVRSFHIPLTREPMDPVVLSQVGSHGSDALYCSLEPRDERVRGIIEAAARAHGLKIRGI